MADFAWLIPLLPFIGFLINGLLGKSLPKILVAVIGTGAMVASFLLATLIFFSIPQGETIHLNIHLFDFIQAGTIYIPFDFLIDPLSILMILIITGIGSLIHLYSAGYMKEDEGFYKFFAYLNLFVFFMLLLVLGSNYIIMFIGWEGVGLCSYLLIGFWFKNQDYNNAAKKAFIMNRIGDLGFLMGVFFIFGTFGTFTFDEVFSKASLVTEFNQPIFITICLLLFVGATGKSAQIPLFTWLPDAMAGPTPVSALIHAATMVTAGIYMIARSNILFVLAPTALTVIAIVGVATALFAATIGLAQNDIKKVLAYSTVSQLGYMFLALGVGAFSSALFHVMTHAFFKALLFLGAGSVIHAMHHEQDIRRMGGLAKKLPITHLTFLIGTLAIAGLPGLSGFFSKDEILAKAFETNIIYWVLGVIGAILTAFYMFRVYFLTFHGSFRGTHDQAHHLHESPLTMTLPLIVLAVLSIVGGYFNLAPIFGGNAGLEHFLSPVFAAGQAKIHHTNHLSHSTEYLIMAVSVVAVILSIGLAYFTYISKKSVPVEDGDEINGLHKLVYNKYYVDELYDKVFVQPIMYLSTSIYKFVDIVVIDGLVNSIGKGIYALSGILRQLQSGSIGIYVLMMVLGLISILAFNLIP